LYAMIVIIIYHISIRTVHLDLDSDSRTADSDLDLVLRIMHWTTDID